MSFNQATLIGRVGRTPETRYTAGGTPVANFSLATNEKFGGKDGEKKERTDWHNVVAFGKLAEIVQQYVAKGSLVFVQGRIQHREWEKDGVKHKATDIVASTVRFLDSKQQAESAKGPEIDDSDIPF